MADVGTARGDVQGGAGAYLRCDEDLGADVGVVVHLLVTAADQSLLGDPGGTGVGPGERAVDVEHLTWLW
jgi:hypothetical protein